jgi:hypothetical protein
MIVLSTVKTWAVAALAAGAAIFGMLFYREKAARKGDQLDASEAARETEHKASDALTGGLKREQDEVERAKEKSARGPRDHFNS